MQLNNNAEEERKGTLFKERLCMMPYGPSLQQSIKPNSRYQTMNDKPNQVFPNLNLMRLKDALTPTVKYLSSSLLHCLKSFLRVGQCSLKDHHCAFISRHPRTCKLTDLNLQSKITCIFFIDFLSIFRNVREQSALGRKSS